MPRTTLLLACLVAAAVGAGAPLVLNGHDPAPGPVRSAAVTSFPDLPASPAPDAVTAALPSQHPAAHTVARVAGPFDDRFQLSALRVARGTLSGVLTVTSDVSEIIELQVVAGFYDAGGHLLGTAVYEKHGEDFADVNERLAFSVRADSAYAGQVSSAAVGVPVLVNE